MATTAPFTVTVESLSPEGFGLAYRNQKSVYIYGALPGETVRVRVLKKRKGRLWCEVDPEPPSPHTPHQDAPGHLCTESEAPDLSQPPDPRIVQPLEDHYVSCSPWQRIRRDLHPKLKAGMLAAAFREAFGRDIPVTGFVDSKERTGYRTKIEYSFWYTSDLHLAFHVRGKPFVCTPVPEGCILASPAMNAVALAIRDQLRKHGIPKRSLKTLTIRESKTRNTRIALLCVQEEEFSPPFRLADIPRCAGLIIAYSDPRSPTSRIDTVLLAEGDGDLEEELRGVAIRYPIDGFFQNNVPVFTQALDAIADAIGTPERLVELYSGVGTIGMALHDRAKEIIGVELAAPNVEYARRNAAVNGITNYTVVAAPAEDTSAYALSPTDTVLLDPPRAGLHPTVIELLRTIKPRQIAYLSCNPITQARDCALLQDVYAIKSLTGFDFYPGTMHLESLVILIK
ncbi:MAG: hypothetical protein N2691_02395 [Patescibacteria group bacterium]|nr:hypothetical protein [Patescibacteria group bacterium]